MPDSLNSSEIDTESWARLYDPKLISAIDAIKHPTPRHGTQHLLAWLADQRNNEGSLAAKVFAAFTGERRDIEAEAKFDDEVTHERAFLDVVRKWHDHILTEPSQLALSTRKQMIAGAKRCLETLSQEGHRGLPHFNRRWLKIGTPSPEKPTPSLGSLDWPELADLKGFDRERTALTVVRDAFLSEFLFYESLFLFGQKLIRSGESSVDEVSDKFIRQQIFNCQQALRRGEIPTIDGRDIRKTFTHFDVNRITGGARGWFRTACLASLGPVVPTASAALGVLLCDTGWNLQPMRDLPRDPFVFRSSTNTYIAERSFIGSFKNRANHHVLGYLGEQSVLTGERLEIAQLVWQDTIKELGTREQHDGYATFPINPDGDSKLSGVDVILRYQAMAEALRENLKDPVAEDYFWIYLQQQSGTPRHWTAASSGVEFSKTHTTNIILSRPGVHSKSIRQTVLMIRYGDTGSMTAVASSAGHSTTRVIMPHYLNKPTVNVELDKNIRNYQNIVEALMVRDLDPNKVAAAFESKPENFERLRRLAIKTGVAASLGLYDNMILDHAEILRFAPTDDRLLELFCIHRKLRLMQVSYLNQERFRREFLPLLAWVKAIGREVFASHLGPRYRHAARRASGLLRRGEIVLPCLED